MAKRQRTPDASEWGDPLTLPGTTQRRRVGPVERGLAKSIQAARKAKQLDDTDTGAVSLARSLARTVDWCETNTEPHTQTLAAARLSEMLTKLRLEPTARGLGGGGDAFDQLLEDIGTPTLGNPTQP